MPPTPRCLVAVPEEEILVTPFLEARVFVVAKRCQRIAADAVESAPRPLQNRNTASGPCPPPYQKTRSPARLAVAEIMRTFMCTVGA
jgi:hypothetical protein